MMDSKPRRLPPLNSLRTLEAIKLSGSVTAAAARLGVSHSAVSHQMKVLENWAQQPLFSRSGRVIMLTTAGESLAQVTHQAFDSIRHEMDRLPTRDMESVSVSAMPVIALRWLAPKLKHYHEQQQAIRLHISIAHSDRPMTPEPDIEILFGLRSRLLANDQPLLSGAAIPVCAPSLLERYDNNPRKLLEAGPLIYDEDLRMWSEWFAHSSYSRKGDPEQPLVLVDDSEMLRVFARQGIGIGLVRSALIQQDLNSGQLIALSDSAIDDDRCYFIRTSPAKRQEPKLARVLKWLETVSAEETMATPPVAPMTAPPGQEPSPRA